MLSLIFHQYFCDFRVDPEQTAGITPETPEAIQKGETYKNSIRQMFVGRSRSIFNNDVSVE